MLIQHTAALQDFIKSYLPRFPELSECMEKAEQALKDDDVTSLVEVYHQVYPFVEKALWFDECFDKNMNYYHAMFREQEGLFRFNNEDDRFQFILSIPVNDRPKQVKNCLDSIYQTCVIYAFGGRTDGIFNRIQVVISDDSREQENLTAHKELAESFTEKGLRVHYFGQQEQYQLMQQIPQHQRKKLGDLLTTQSAEQFYHKGQAANRNLSYLKCLQLTEDKDKTLYYFVDSDQLFRVTRNTRQGDLSVSGLNYFYYINHIFSTTSVNMLTAKLVGDPPVSPSIMASRFLDDVIAFFDELGAQDGDQSCSFNQISLIRYGEAAHLDRESDLGVESSSQPFPYCCAIKSEHTNLECLIEFSEKLNSFFYGQHLTRQTPFYYDDIFTSLTPARTIYPGNYVVNYEGLKYIIPFGYLRLGISGSTAGRLIQAEIGDRLASVNLPMLHTRSLHQSNDSEFRPGVEDEDSNLDLSDKFERQFFGDLMLLSVSELTGDSDFDGDFELTSINRVLDKMEKKLLEQYEIKHQEVLQKIEHLEYLVEDHQCWWHKLPESNPAMIRCRYFIQNMRQNFSDDSIAYQQIHNPAHREQRKQQIREALLQYREARDAWDELFI